MRKAVRPRSDSRSAMRRDAGPRLNTFLWRGIVIWRITESKQHLGHLNDADEERIGVIRFF